MAGGTFTVINSTQATFTAASGAAGTKDVGAMSYRDGIVYDTDARVLIDVGTLGIAVIKDQTGVAFKEQIKRAIGLAAMYLNPLA